MPKGVYSHYKHQGFQLGNKCGREKSVATLAEEARIKASPGFQKGNQLAKMNSGANHYRWNPNRDEVSLDRRNDGGYKEWAKEVRIRDENTCNKIDENCLGYNIVHHIFGWADYPEERYNIDNGVMLCKFHHRGVHYFAKASTIP